MKNYFLLITITSFFAFAGCIGDDIILDTVPERLVINNPVDSIQLNSTYQFETTFFNNIGQPASRTVNWTSTDENVLSIDDQGLASGNELGGATVIASATQDDNSTITDEFTLWVTEGETVIIEEPTERSGQIRSTSSYPLSGDFTLKVEGSQLVLSIADNYETTSSLPGLYVYLSNNPNTTNGAYEIGEVTTFSGAHSYTFSGVGINEYNHVLYFCKPFSVKVGDGEME
jgi:hypothetical protein